MLRFLIHGTALAVLGIAIYRFVHHLVSGPAVQSSQPFRVNQQRRGHSRLLDSRTVFIAQSDNDSAVKRSYRRGDVVTIFQESVQNNRCVLGQLQFHMRKSDGVIFKAQKNLRSSNLAVWAQRHQAPLNFKVIPHQHTDLPMPFIQLCRRWIELTNTDTLPAIATMKTKFFLSGRTFTQVSATNANKEIRIQSDLLRSGWRVQAPPGRHELYVRHAESGLLHRLTVRVEQTAGALSGKKKKPLKRHNQTTELIIPGWD